MHHFIIAQKWYFIVTIIVCIQSGHITGLLDIGFLTIIIFSRMMQNNQIKTIVPLSKRCHDPQGGCPRGHHGSIIYLKSATKGSSSITSVVFVVNEMVENSKKD